MGELNSILFKTECRDSNVIYEVLSVFDVTPCSLVNCAEFAECFAFMCSDDGGSRIL